MIRHVAMYIIALTLILQANQNHAGNNKAFGNALKYGLNDDGNGLNKAEFETYINSIYEVCKLKDLGLNYEVFKKGLVGYYNISKHHNIDKNVISIIDFQKPSHEERLWIIDLKNKKILQHSLVAHGKNSGSDIALNFSNTPNSNMSSLGFYLTKNTYIGKHGLSLVIKGLDKNFNSNAEARSVVIHGAEYVSPEFIKCNGRIGRSQGCPALPVSTHKEIINMIAYGSVIFISHDNQNYKSDLLNEVSAAKEFCKRKIN